jgi:hypothetical protein
MPNTNLEHQLSSLSVQDNVAAPMSKPEGLSGVSALVTPTKSVASASDQSFESNESDQEEEAEDRGRLVNKTEHKLQEEQGLFADEPLLKANPHRFVIFPIQDNDVS